MRRLCVPSSDPVQRLTDILENIARIREFTAGLDLTAFVRDLKTCDAVERCLERISEAANKLGDMAVDLCPDIPWPQIRAIGNRLRHEYDRIDAARIWFMLERDLAPLKAAVLSALNKVQEDKSDSLLRRRPERPPAGWEPAPLTPSLLGLCGGRLSSGRTSAERRPGR